MPVVAGLLALGTVSAHAAVSFPAMTLTAKQGGSAVASARVTNASHGWVPLNAKHHSSGKFALRDEKSSDGHKAYADIITSISYNYCMPFFGGKCTPQVRSKQVAAASSARTGTSSTPTVIAMWAPESYLSVTTAYAACIDRRLATDVCHRVAKTSTAKQYNS